MGNTLIAENKRTQHTYLTGEKFSPKKLLLNPIFITTFLKFSIQKWNLEFTNFPFFQNIYALSKKSIF